MSLTARVKDMYYRYFPERDPAYKGVLEEVDVVLGEPSFTQEEFDLAVRELPLQHREALMLHKAGMSSLQIAREMKVTEAIARKWVTKAYSGIRIKLNWPDDDGKVLQVAPQPLNVADHPRRRDDGGQRSG